MRDCSRCGRPRNKRKNRRLDRKVQDRSSAREKDTSDYISHRSFTRCSSSPKRRRSSSRSITPRPNRERYRDNISNQNDNHSSKSRYKECSSPEPYPSRLDEAQAPSSLGELLSATQQQHQGLTTSSSQGQINQSESTAHNDDSATNDIYDPSEPIVPISPGDSPPLSEYDREQIQDTADKHANDDDVVPSSAVQLNQQEKYLKKLNRQERVVEEVKIALKPYYTNRTIDKEQYKDVLRKAVPKICHDKHGEINPFRIKSLVDVYVKKIKHRRAD